MNKKRLLGLILFAELVIAALFLGAGFMVSQGSKADTGNEQSYTKEDSTKEVTKGIDSKEQANLIVSPIAQEDDVQEEQQIIDGQTMQDDTLADAEATIMPIGEEETTDTFSTSIEDQVPKLIIDSSQVDYKTYIPDMITDSKLEVALDIDNPQISIDAQAAILFDANTKEVLYYKNPVQAMFPASTAKLLTTLVVLNWCDPDDEVTVGEEIKMIASDSTRAYLHVGQALTIRNLLAGMLLPSGNDAAYAVAGYVGRKSLDNPDATKEEAVVEFIRLMNKEAKSLGVKNSCFKTPDGYDAIGQYTTAYDMGLIGVAAANNSTITEISSKSCSRNIFVSGEDVTWDNTNKLVTRYSGQYYSHAIGLKTGTSSMAGRCIIAAAEEDGKKVVCVVLDSTMQGRWEDAITLLKYGLE